MFSDGVFILFLSGSGIFGTEGDKVKIQESAENYLETILSLKSKKNEVRSIDVANELGFSKPSISRAVSLFKQEGYITVDEHGIISLTETGLRIARRVSERHETLMKFLISIGVSEKTAEDDACRIEHVISEEAFNKIKEKLS